MHIKQQGYFLVIAVIFILVIGVMGSLVAYLLAGRARISPAELGGMQAFYLAESGLEVAARLLVGTGVSSPLTCATLTGAGAVTNAALLNGTFTATAVNNAVYSASTTLSGAVTASSTTFPLTSTTGLATHGRVRVDSEAIDYAAISGGALVGLTRGASGTTATSHSAGAIVAENICLVNVTAGIPSIASPTYQRQLEMAVEILYQGDAWIVGNRSSNLFSLLRWNTPTASAWNNSSFSDSTYREDLNGVSIARDQTGWAVGNVNGSNFTFLRWNGSAWSVTPLSGACNGQNLSSVSSISATEAWAVGVRYTSTCSGSSRRYTIMRWNGSTWTPLTNATTPSAPGPASSNQNLNAVSMADTDNSGAANIGFAVGDGGTILMFNGANWVTDAQSKVITTQDLTGVYTVSAAEAWAVGKSGVIIKWNGSSWSSVSSPTSTQLNEISMLDSDADGLANVGWAVGNLGTIVYYNGSTWATQTSGTNSQLLGIAVGSASQAWAVGASGMIQAWNGTSWATQSSPISVQLNAVSIAIPGATNTGSLVGSWQQIFR